MDRPYEERFQIQPFNNKVWLSSTVTPAANPRQMKRLRSEAMDEEDVDLRSTTSDTKDSQHPSLKKMKFEVESKNEVYLPSANRIVVGMHNNLSTMPPEILYEIFDKLNPIESVCLGLTEKRMYSIHFKRHGRINLQGFIMKSGEFAHFGCQGCTKGCQLSVFSLLGLTWGCRLFRHLNYGVFWQDKKLRYCKLCKVFSTTTKFPNILHCDECAAKRIRRWGLTEESRLLKMERVIIEEKAREEKHKVLKERRERAAMVKYTKQKDLKK